VENKGTGTLPTDISTFRFYSEVNYAVGRRKLEKLSELGSELSVPPSNTPYMVGSHVWRKNNLSIRASEISFSAVIII
jgi:hypothetical protein